MVAENILKVTAIPPGSTKIREISCIESEVKSLVAYLTRRGYDNIRIMETIIQVKERRAELW